MPNHLSDEATFRHGGEGKQMWKRTRREDLERFHAGNLWVSRSFFLPASLRSMRSFAAIEWPSLASISVFRFVPHPARRGFIRILRIGFERLREVVGSG